MEEKAEAEHVDCVFVSVYVGVGCFSSLLFKLESKQAFLNFDFRCKN